MYIIKIETALTPKVFYHVLLKKIGEFCNTQLGENDRDLMLDISGCNVVEGNVISNLLNLGAYLKNCIGREVYIYIATDNREIKSGKYLSDMNFFKMAEEYKIFNLKYIRGRISGEYKLPNYCGTTVLVNFRREDLNRDIHRTEDYYKQYVREFVEEKYHDMFLNFREFDYYYIEKDEYIPINLLKLFSFQLCVNTVLHTESDCFLTMQVNRKLKKATIAIADYGKGFYASIIERRRKCPTGEWILVKNIENKNENDMEARTIVEAMAYRYSSSIYGLFHLFYELVKSQGTIRIHSGRTRVTFCGKDFEEYHQEKTKEKFVKKLWKYLAENNRIEETVFYTGVHVEIEIPLKGE